MIPPSAGPTLRTVLKPTDVSVRAAGRSRLFTISPTEACQAGSLKAIAQPARKLKPRIIQGLRKPRATTMVSAPPATVIRHRAVNMTLRLSKLSTMAPANTDRRKGGRVAEACTSATIRFDDEIVAMSQLIATVWINQPSPDTSPANQIARNVLFLSGEKGADEIVCVSGRICLFIASKSPQSDDASALLSATELLMTPAHYFIESADTDPMLPNRAELLREASPRSRIRP